jgi:hypothetical protein
MRFSDLDSAFGVSGGPKLSDAVRERRREAGLAGLREESTSPDASAPATGSQATFFGAFGPAVDEADAAIQRVLAATEKTFHAAEQELSLGLPEVQLKIYRAVADLEERGLRESFLMARDVRPHGNTRNTYTPVLRAFTNSKHKYLRQTLAKSAAMIALARREKVSPEDFGEWRKKWTNDQAARAWRELQKTSETEDHERLVIKFLLPDPKTPFLPSVGPTKGCAGRRLAVLDCAEDLTGKYRVIGLVPCDEDEVRRIISSVLRKNARRKKTAKTDAGAALPS